MNTRRVTTCLFLASASLANAFHLGVNCPHRTIGIKTLQPRYAVDAAAAVPIEGIGNNIDTAKSPLADHDAWIATLDYDGFAKEVTALGKDLLQESGPADIDHLNKILRWRNIAALVGIATMWLPVNPIAVVALSTWTYSSWTMIAHHTCHGGYNRMDAGKYNSRGFALGTVWRRVQDWCDWMKPEAWNIEHPATVLAVCK